MSLKSGSLVSSITLRDDCLSLSSVEHLISEENNRWKHSNKTLGPVLCWSVTEKQNPFPFVYNPLLLVTDMKVGK